MVTTMSQDESSPIRVAAEKEKRRRLGVKNLAERHLFDHNQQPTL